jgi:predicted TIM-barrel fold metal-dependent hydrolase
MWDVSAFVGDWPFRRLPDCTPEALEQRLRREGFQRAYVSPLDGLFAGDPQPANAHWGDILRESTFFHFVPILNPMLPGWERSLAACREQGAAAVRLVPNYHGYSAQEEAAKALAQAAGGLHLPVMIQLRMQDTRAMHPRAPVPDVDWREAAALARACPQTPLIVVAASWPEACKLLEETRALPGCYLTLSHLEVVDGVWRLVEQFGTERLLMGTHAPLFTPTSARVKVEMSRLSAAQKYALCEGNARQLWGEGSFPR